MRKRLFQIYVLAALVFSVCILESCSSRAEKARDYNDGIITHQARIVQSFDALDTTFNRWDEDEMEYAHIMVQAEVKKGLRALDSIGPFKKDSTLLIAADELFEFYESVAEKEYAQLIELMKIPQEQYTSEDMNQALELENQIRQGFVDQHANFSAIQKSFGEKNNVVIE